MGVHVPLTSSLHSQHPLDALRTELDAARDALLARIGAALDHDNDPARAGEGVRQLMFLTEGTARSIAVIATVAVV